MPPFSFPLEPREKLSPEFLEELKNLNARKNKKQITFVDYMASIRILLGKKNILILSENYKFFLGGFICGEGSINVSFKNIKAKSPNVTLGSQFSVTQHINACSHLIACLQLFQTGRIYHKLGSNATMVYTIDNRSSIAEKVLPFWKEYILPYQSGEESRRFTIFEQLLKLLQAGKHLSKEEFAFSVLPLWNSLRKQQGQSNEKFKDLKAAQDFVLSRK